MTVWDFDHYQYFIRSLLLAHQWETGGDALMGTIIGRHVYLCVISELQPNGKISESNSLKQVFSHPTFTDRAIRLKLREFESEGYITMEVNASDGRTRSIRVTDKFETSGAAQSAFASRLQRAIPGDLQSPPERDRLTAPGTGPLLGRTQTPLAARTARWTRSNIPRCQRLRRSSVAASAIPDRLHQHKRILSAYFSSRQRAQKAIGSRPCRDEATCHIWK